MSSAEEAIVLAHNAFGVAGSTTAWRPRGYEPPTAPARTPDQIEADSLRDATEGRR